MKNKSRGIAVGVALLTTAMSTSSQASLIDIGGGLIYDDALNITWLQNANLSATESFGVMGISDGTDGFSAGSMTWDTANLWIDAMNSNSYLGFNTWRLPTVTPLNGVSFNYAPIHDGSHDRGYNISETGTLYADSIAHEMAHLFYSTLGNDAKCAPSTATNDAGCLDRSEPANYAPWGLLNTGPFSGLIADRYWYKQENTLDNLRAFDFNFIDGQTGTSGKSGHLLVWAVLDGNPMAVIPVPAAAWLFGSGLLGLVAVSRRRSL